MRLVKNIWIRLKEVESEDNGAKVVNSPVKTYEILMLRCTE